MANIFPIYQKYSITTDTGNIIEFDNAIDYIKYKRRVERYKEPVIFTSNEKLDNLLSKPNNKILRAIGHDFLRVPYRDEDIEKIERHISPLNDIQLQDIIINFCHLKSAVRNGFHDFKGTLRAIMGKTIPDDEKVNLLLSEFDEYRKELKRDAGDYKDVLFEFDRIVSLFKPSDISTIEKVQSIQEESLACFLPDDDDEFEQSRKVLVDWKILFLDDNPEELQVIFKLLKERGIEYEFASSCQSAMRIINDDHMNRITVVVSDYRLYEKIDKYLEPRMQREQGYDFLFWLCNQNRYNAHVALSGLSKWFLFESFRKHNMNVKIYSKNSLLGGGTNLFIDDLEYLGRQFNDVVINQPQALMWRNNKLGNNGDIVSHKLNKYYIYHRNCNEYLSSENMINRQAEQIAREAEFAMDKSSNFNFGATLSIFGGCTTNMKGKPDTEYPIFLKKLLQRRILYYLFLQGFQKDAIIKLLHKGSMNVNISDGMLKQVPYYLAVNWESDIPDFLLVEDKYFLHNIMGIDIHRFSELSCQAHTIVNTIVTNVIDKNEELIDNINKYLIYDETSNKWFASSVSIWDAHNLLECLVMHWVSLSRFNEALTVINDLIIIIDEMLSLTPNMAAVKKLRFNLLKLRKKCET